MTEFETDLAAAATPDAALAALHGLADRLFGARLFTVMSVDLAAGVARRPYTSDPENYPASGTKPMSRDAWFEARTRGETFVANSIEEIDAVFPDADLIAQLGCGACANLPVIRGGDLVGTVNILDRAGFWTAARVLSLEKEMRLPAMAALNVHDLLRG
ncbi:MAG: GAF domain-containing protein [Jannaschia sp.]